MDYAFFRKNGARLAEKNHAASPLLNEKKLESVDEKLHEEWTISA